MVCLFISKLESANKNYNNPNNLIFQSMVIVWNGLLAPHALFMRNRQTKNCLTHSRSKHFVVFVPKSRNKFRRLLMTACESETVNWTFSWFSCQFHTSASGTISYKMHHSNFQRLFNSQKNTYDFILN